MEAHGYSLPMDLSPGSHQSGWKNQRVDRRQGAGLCVLNSPSLASVALICFDMLGTTMAGVVPPHSLAVKSLKTVLGEKPQ